MDVVEAFTVREEEMDAAASEYAEPWRRPREGREQRRVRAKIPLSSPGRHRRRSRSRSTRITCLPCVCWLSSSLLGPSGSVPETGRRQARPRGTGGCALVGSRTVRPGGRLPFDDRHRMGLERPHASPASRRDIGLSLPDEKTAERGHGGKPPVDTLGQFTV